MSKSQSNRQHQNNFAYGRGVFACEDCGRQTRGTSESLDAKVCAECYELAGLENMFSDEGEANFGPSWVAMVNELLAKLEAAGGSVERVKAGGWTGMYEFVEAQEAAPSSIIEALQAKQKVNLLNLCYNANGTVTLYLNGKKHSAHTTVGAASEAGLALGGKWGVIYDRTKK